MSNHAAQVWFTWCFGKLLLHSMKGKFCWNLTRVCFLMTLQQYPDQAEFTPDVLVKWIFANTHQICVWVTPPGVKSLTLAPYVEEGSVLILFTPRNPLQDWNYNYNMVSIACRLLSMCSSEGR
jgi:hypothetical protein